MDEPITVNKSTITLVDGYRSYVVVSRPYTRDTQTSSVTYPDIISNPTDLADWLMIPHACCRVMGLFSPFLYANR